MAAEGRLNKCNASCCVPFCVKTGYVQKDGKKVTFHSLPIKRPEMLRRYEINIRRDRDQTLRLTNTQRFVLDILKMKISS